MQDYLSLSRLIRTATTTSTDKSSSSSARTPAGNVSAPLVLPSVSLDNLTRGQLLGKGGFCVVHQVTCSLQSSEQTFEYALKKPVVPPAEINNSSESENDSDDEDLQHAEAEAAARDLKREAMILSRLPAHTNVIQLHASSTQFWENPLNGFLVLTLLPDTLDKRLRRWARLPEARRKQKQRFMNIAPGISSAMAFLHGNNIIYRDCKPPKYRL